MGHGATPLGAPAERAGEQSAGEQDASVGELISQLTTQTSRLVRDELRLAQNELQATAKKAGRGAGLLGGAGVIGLYGFGALIATVIIALGLVLAWWAAALIVAVGLFLVAGIAALAGKAQLRKAFPPTPKRTVQNVKRDVRQVKESSHHEHY